MYLRQPNIIEISDEENKFHRRLQQRGGGIKKKRRLDNGEHYEILQGHLKVEY